MIERLSTRAIAIIVAVIAAVLIVGFTVRSCDKRHARAAQSRVERSQGEAHSNSAADAVNTVAASGEASAASEALTRANEQQIRAAQGSGDKVNRAAQDAGIAALCKRAAYKDDPRCKKP